MNSSIETIPEWFAPAEAGTRISALPVDRLREHLSAALDFIRSEMIDKPDVSEIGGKQVLSLPNFAKRWGVTRVTVHNWIRAGILPNACVLRPSIRRSFIDVELADKAIEASRGRPKSPIVCGRRTIPADAEDVDPLDCEPSTATATARRTPTTKAAAPAKRRASRAA